MLNIPVVRQLQVEIREELRHMRGDSLARELDRRRWGSLGGISPQPAIDLYRMGTPSVSGADVANVYGLLSHYTTSQRLAQMINVNLIGGGHGCWLTTTPYGACVAPYNLGLDSPRELCVLIDVRSLRQLWGPGTCPPSYQYRNIWLGGAIEFFSPTPIPFNLVRRVCEIFPCGDCQP